MSQLDHIHTLGYTAMGSRLKRISDSLFGDCTNFYEANHIDFEPTAFPLLTLIDQEGRLTLSEAASALGLSHAAISQKATQMVKSGWATLTSSEDDKRSKYLQLTDKGRKLVVTMQPLWYAIRQTLTEVTDSLPYPVLELMDKLEHAIADANLPQRMATNLRHFYDERITIERYSSDLAPYFESINRQWIEEYFVVEPHDATVLGDPQTHVIDRGGMVYFAKLDDTVVGTAALYKEANDSYEFTKMGIDTSLRGKGIGRKLMKYVIKDAKNTLGAKRIYILTNAALNPACHLYRTMGFVDIPLTSKDKAKYQRADVKMELWLEETAIYAA